MWYGPTFEDAFCALRQRGQLPVKYRWGLYYPVRYDLAKLIRYAGERTCVNEKFCTKIADEVTKHISDLDNLSESYLYTDLKEWAADNGNIRLLQASIFAACKANYVTDIWTQRDILDYVTKELTGQLFEWPYINDCG